MSILISVITACYNSEKTIRKTFDAMLAQTYQNYEYVIVDGGSTDNTLAIIEEYMPKFQGKMSCMSEPDKGIYDAMNKGIKRCHGDLIGINNSDDWYEPDTLEQIVTNYQGNQYEVVYGMMRTIRDGKANAILFYHHDFLSETMINHPTCFVTKDTYRDLGAFDAENYRSSADYELMIRYQKSGKVIFTPIYSILANFTLGGMSGSNTGVRETARLKRSLGLISKKKYMITLTKAMVNDLIGNNWKRK